VHIIIENGENDTFSGSDIKKDIKQKLKGEECTGQMQRKIYCEQP
jgi:hypothetical protein